MAKTMDFDTWRKRLLPMTWERFCIHAAVDPLDRPGNSIVVTYPNWLYIEVLTELEVAHSKNDPAPRYSVMLERRRYVSHDLEELERRLYEYAADAGFLRSARLRAGHGGAIYTVDDARFDETGRMLAEFGFWHHLEKDERGYTVFGYSPHTNFPIRCYFPNARDVDDAISLTSDTCVVCAVLEGNVPRADALAVVVSGCLKFEDKEQ